HARPRAGNNRAASPSRSVRGAESGRAIRTRNHRPLGGDYVVTTSRWKPCGDGIAPPIPEFLSRVTATAGPPSSHAGDVSPEKGSGMTKPTSTEKVVPITVGNPSSIASYVIDQSHMEEFTKTEEENSSVVEVKRPPRGTHFTVPKEEEGKPNSLLVFLLELPRRETY